MPFAGILDEAGSRDPFTITLGEGDDGATSPDGALTCALAGSIYNLPELVEALQLHPDGGPAATLLAGWERAGEGLAPLLRGDFAIAIWDSKAGEGVLIRDQLAIGGLYWHALGSRVAFASEVHLLLRLLPERPGPDPASMAGWLALQGPPPGRTLYQGVNRLEAGHLLRFGGSPPRPERYWQPTYATPLRASREELVGLLRERLTEAIRRRSAPQETSVLLSGGLDSSTVAALATSSLPGEQRPGRAYSAVFPDHPSVDEQPLIDTLCRSIELPSTRIVVRGGSVLAGAQEYLGRWELPPTSPNLFFWLPLLRRAHADGSRVMLDGEGGDEVFSLSLAVIGDHLRHGRVRSATRLAGSVWSLQQASRRQRFDYAWRPALKALVPSRLHEAARRVRGPRAYAPPWFLEPTARAFWETTSGGQFKQIPGPRWWSTLVQNITRGTAAAIGYDHMRRRAALTGIQPRHPLVDVDVIELVLSFPPELAFDRRWSRPLLREATAGLLPDELRLRRDKSNFDAVFHAALAGPDLPVLRKLLGDSRAELGAYLDMDLVRRDLLDPDPPSTARARQDWALACWRMATAELWLRGQTDPDGVHDLLSGAREPEYELMTR